MYTLSWSCRAALWLWLYSLFMWANLVFNWCEFGLIFLCYSRLTLSLSPPPVQLPSFLLYYSNNNISNIQVLIQFMPLFFSIQSNLIREHKHAQNVIISFLSLISFWSCHINKICYWEIAHFSIKQHICIYTNRNVKIKTEITTTTNNTPSRSTNSNF